MIEMAQFDELAVRVTGFRRFDRHGRAAFSLVVLVPGIHASDELSRLLARKRITLTLVLDDGEKETRGVSVELHDMQQAGHPGAPIFRHQIEFVERHEGDPLAPNEIEAELAAILARLDRLLDALEEAGVAKREVVESIVKANARHTPEAASAAHRPEQHDEDASANLREVGIGSPSRRDPSIQCAANSTALVAASPGVSACAITPGRSGTVARNTASSSDH